MELVVSGSNENLTSWRKKSYLSDVTKELLRQADVLMVPDEDFRDYPLPVFQRNTLEILDYLNANLRVEAAINEEDFREVALNNRIHRIGKYIVNTVVFPVFVGLITCYIYDKLKHEDPKDEVELEIVVDDGTHSKSVKFRGTVDDLKRLKQDIIDLRDGEDGKHRADSARTAATGH
jgi:hypothetical protein